MNEKENTAIISKPNVKRTIADSFFIKLFSNAENLLALYNTLLDEREKLDNITVDDITLLDIRTVMINDLYNDLSFVVKDELIIMTEAQSTYTKNIVTRLLLYVSRAIEEYLRKQNEDNSIKQLYNSKTVILPKIKLFTIYTGERRLNNHTLRLSDIMANNNLVSDLDLRVEVICEESTVNVLGQYMTFCSVYRKQAKIYDDNLEALKKTIEICMNKDILTQFLSERKYEVNKMIAPLMTRDEWIEIQIRDSEKRGEKRGINIGEKRGIALGEKRGEIKGLLRAGLDIDKIMELTNANKEEIIDLQKQLLN